MLKFKKKIHASLPYENSKKKKISGVDVYKQELLTSDGRNQKGTATFKDSLVASDRIKHALTT